MNIKNDIKDINLSKVGYRNISWAANEMPVLNNIRKAFSLEKPLNNVKIAACLHVTTETANLMITLKEAGAEIALCASNPLSTQDDVSASLVNDYSISTFAINGENNESYYKHIKQVLDFKPDITMDDGADLVSVLHKEHKNLLPSIIGGTEETTTGVIRLRAMANEKKLLYPIVAVNEADTKHMFDNRYGTGQSTIDGITRATNLLWAGKNVVVFGYGWCGRGIASRAQGLGANVIVTEMDSIKALEAVMDGFRVMHSEKASAIGDILITATGGLNTIGEKHFKKIKNGAILANSGHFNVEIDLNTLKKMSINQRTVKNLIEEYTLKNNRIVHVIAEGRLVNLAAAEGHPSSVMDMSFSNQALSVKYLIQNVKKLKNEVYAVPKIIDRSIGKLKLQSMGIKIDKLDKEQKKYLNSWQHGT